MDFEVRGAQLAGCVPRMSPGLTRIIALAFLFMLFVVAGGTAAGAARAETAGDFVQNYGLGPAESISPYPFDNYKYHELEGWSKSGTAACVGVSSASGGSHPGTGSWLGSECDGNGSPPDEVYCRSNCVNKTGYPFVHDHSGSKSDNFTGWLYAF